MRAPKIRAPDGTSRGGGSRRVGGLDDHTLIGIGIGTAGIDTGLLDCPHMTLVTIAIRLLRALAVGRGKRKPSAEAVRARRRSAAAAGATTHADSPMIAATGIARRMAPSDMSRSPAFALCQNNTELMIFEDLRSMCCLNAKHVQGLTAQTPSKFVPRGRRRSTAGAAAASSQFSTVSRACLSISREQTGSMASACETSR